MNKNKGFIGIGLIVAIVLGILVVGGGAYYLGKSGSKPVVINPENILPNNENQNLPVVDNSQQVNVTNPTTPTVATGCTSTSTPSIKVLSPNGGEVYKAGDKITVKWSSCNVEANTQLRIYLSESLSSGAHANSIPIIQSTFNDGVETFVNDGSEAFVLDSTIYDYFGKTDGYQFKIYIVDSCSGSGCIGPSDYSDNSFTINSASSTSNWKTYTNTKYGFSIQYPAEMSVNQDPDTFANVVWLMISSNNSSPGDRLDINVTSPLYDGGREDCNKGWDNNNYYTHVNINNLDFIKGDLSSAYSGMNSRTVATGYCYTITNGNQYRLNNVGTPSTTVSNIINSFKLTK